MLRANLASRPFYNVRAVQIGLGVLGLLVVALMLFNVVQFVRLSALERSLGTDAAADEAEAARLRAEAAGLLSQIDRDALEAAAVAVDEANGIIDRRTFSWTALLTWLERTLPRNARVTRIQPGEQQGGAFPIVLETEAYDIGDLNQFVEALEDAEPFRNVLARQQSAAEGLIQARVEALYVPPGPGAGGGTGNEPAAGGTRD